MQVHGSFTCNTELHLANPDTAKNAWGFFWKRHRPNKYEKIIKCSFCGRMKLMWNMVKTSRVHPPTNSPEVIRMLFCLTLFCVPGKSHLNFENQCLLYIADLPGKELLSFTFKTGACMPPRQVDNRIQADNHSFNQSCTHEALTNTFVSLKSFCVFSYH